MQFLLSTYNIDISRDLGKKPFDPIQEKNCRHITQKGDNTKGDPSTLFLQEIPHFFSEIERKKIGKAE